VSEGEAPFPFTSSESVSQTKCRWSPSPEAGATPLKEGSEGGRSHRCSKGVPARSTPISKMASPSCVRTAGCVVDESGPPVAFVLGGGTWEAVAFVRSQVSSRAGYPQRKTGRDGQIAPISCSRSGVPRPNRNVRKHRVLGSRVWSQAPLQGFDAAKCLRSSGMRPVGRAASRVCAAARPCV
jgi:hypothetical protein